MKSIAKSEMARMVRKDCKQRWISHNCLPVTNPQAGYLGRRCSNKDINTGCSRIV
jgi:hypothetical protein